MGFILLVRSWRTVSLCQGAERSGGEMGAMIDKYPSVWFRCKTGLFLMITYVLLGND